MHVSIVPIKLAKGCYVPRELHSLLPADSSPSPPIHTHFLLPRAILGHFKIQVPAQPTRRVPSTRATNMCYLHCTPLHSARAACCCRLLLPTTRYVYTTEIGPSRLPTSLGAILVPLMCTRSDICLLYCIRLFCLCVMWFFLTSYMFDC